MNKPKKNRATHEGRRKLYKIFFFFCNFKKKGLILRLGQKETKKKHLKQQARHNLCQVIKLDDIKPRIDTTRFENGSELHT